MRKSLPPPPPFQINTLGAFIRALFVFLPPVSNLRKAECAENVLCSNDVLCD